MVKLEGLQDVKIRAASTGLVSDLDAKASSPPERLVILSIRRLYGTCVEVSIDVRW
jgi:hypothetical protein